MMGDSWLHSLGLKQYDEIHGNNSITGSYDENEQWQKILGALEDYPPGQNSFYMRGLAALAVGRALQPWATGTGSQRTWLARRCSGAELGRVQDALLDLIGQCKRAEARGDKAFGLMAQDIKVIRVNACGALSLCLGKYRDGSSGAEIKDVLVEMEPKPTEDLKALIQEKAEKKKGGTKKVKKKQKSTDVSRTNTLSNATSNTLASRSMASLEGGLGSGSSAAKQIEDRIKHYTSLSQNSVFVEGRRSEPDMSPIDISKTKSFGSRASSDGFRTLKTKARGPKRRPQKQRPPDIPPPREAFGTLSGPLIKPKYNIPQAASLRTQQQLLSTTGAPIFQTAEGPLQNTISTGRDTASANLRSTHGNTRVRPSVIFAEKIPEELQGVPLADQQPENLVEMDRRLGYQVSRVWYPQNHGAEISKYPPGLSPSRQVSSPARPVSSELLKREYLQTRAYHDYQRIKDWWSDFSNDPAGRPPTDNFANLKLSDSRPTSQGIWADWSPRIGTVPNKDQTEEFGLGTANSVKFQKTNLASTGYLGSTGLATQRLNGPVDEEANKLKSGTVHTASPYGVKVTVRGKMAGAKHAYQSRALDRLHKQREKEKRGILAQGPSRKPSNQDPTLIIPGMVVQPEFLPGSLPAEAMFSKAQAKIDQAASKEMSRPSSPYHEVQYLSAEEEDLPRPGTAVHRDTLTNYLEATKKVAHQERKVDEISREAKEIFRRRRVNAIVSQLRRPSATELEESIVNFEKERQAIQDHQDSINRQMQASVELQFEAMPLRYLFTVPGGAEFIRKKLQRAFGLWIREFERNQMTVALSLWKICTFEVVYAQRGKLYMVYAGGFKLATTVKKIRRKIKERRLNLWLTTVRYMIYFERIDMALRIQTCYRRWCSLKYLHRLHNMGPWLGPLTDMFLEQPRMKLPFHIPHKIRVHRVKLWESAIIIQTVFRWKPQRWYFLKLKKNALKLQSHFRMWSDRRAFKALREYAIKIQALIRGFLAQKDYWPKVWAVHPIQRLFRGYSVRVKVWKMWVKQWVTVDPAPTAAQKIQRLYRGHMGRKIPPKIREENLQMELAALRVQRSWYRRNNAFTTFILLFCLSHQDSERKRFARKVNNFFRFHAARKLQQYYRARRDEKHQRAARCIQSWWRMMVAWNLLANYRRELWGARKIRAFLKGAMARRHAASRLIAFTWWKNQPGRFVGHLIQCAMQFEAEELRKWQEERDRAACAIQAIVHGVWERRVVRRMLSALHIQKVVRGFLARRRVYHMVSDMRHDAASAYIKRIMREGVYKEMYRYKKLQIAKAVQIQAIARRYIVRVGMARLFETAVAQVFLAARIQNAWRSHQRMKAALRNLAKQRRRMRNPYVGIKKWSNVLAHCTKDAEQYYNPANECMGMGLVSWLRRLGMDRDVYPLLKAQGITHVHQLEGKTDQELQDLGIKEEIHGTARKGVFGADSARQIMLVLLKNIPKHKRTSYESMIYDGFALIGADQQKHMDESGVGETIWLDGTVSVVSQTSMDTIQTQQTLKSKATFKSNRSRKTIASRKTVNTATRRKKKRFKPTKKEEAILKLFDNAYGKEYRSRGINMAQQLSEVGVSQHQLRRFFQRYNTPGLAKENMNELLDFPQAEEQAKWDEERTLKSLDTLRYGVQMMEELSPNAPEMEELMLLSEQLFRQKQPDDSDSQGFGLDTVMGHSEALAYTTGFHYHFRRCYDLDTSASLIQKVWRGHHGKDLLALTRHQMKVTEVHKKYMWEKNTNHVELEWKEARRLEKEEYERKHREWLAEEERKKTLERLKLTLRWPWQEEWQKAYGDRGAEEWRCLYRLGEYGDPTAKYQDERPIYTIEEDTACKVLQRAVKAFLARTLAWRIQREQEKQRKEQEEKKRWEQREKERQRQVSVRLNFINFRPTVEYKAAMKKNVSLDGVESESDDEETKKLLQVDLEEEPNVKLCVGFPVEARFDGGEHYYQGTVYQVNPTKYNTKDGIKEYPKGTFGVLYDDGDMEPAVPRKMLRVIKLREGMKVEVNYEGGGTYYPATVVGENVRDGKVLSYQVQYEDGEFGKAVLRSLIKVDANVFIKLQEDLRKKKHRRLVEAARRRAAAARKRKQGRLWLTRCDQIRRRFMEAWKPDKVRRKDEWDAYNSLIPLARPLNPNASDIVKMIKASRDLFHAKRPCIRLDVKIEYTRAAMRFGWTETYDPQSGMNYYQSLFTGESSWEIPFYSFEEEHAVSSIQSVFRAYKGRLEFQRYLAQEGLVKLIDTAIADGTKHSWVPGGDEGISVTQWLARAGFYHLAVTIERAAAKKSRASRRKKGAKRPATAASTLPLAKFLTFSEEQLEKYGVENVRDRRALLNVLDATPEEIQQLFKFVNYYSNGNDKRNIRECISAGYPAIHALLMKKWYKNKKRVERMATEICRSRFPVTYCQIKTFIEKYENTPGKAQDFIQEMVDVPTTGTNNQEIECYKVYKTGTSRLMVLLGNLHMERLKSNARLTLFKAETMIDHSNPLGEDEESYASQMSGNSAKAAWLVRAQVFDTTKKWYYSAIKIQKVFRVYRAVVHFRILLMKRWNTAKLVQACWRRKVAYKEAQILRLQQASDWEQLFDESEGNFYYFNKATEDSMWQEPNEYYRPMIRDYFTAQLLQAWPHLDMPTHEDDPTPEGYCMRCKEERASRVCNECVATGQDWGDGYFYYCFLCFQEGHAGDYALANHTFTVTSETTAEPLRCTLCNELSTRHCFGLKVQPFVFEDLQRRIGAAHGSDEPVDQEEFQKFIKHSRLDYSKLRVDALFKECNTGSPYQFWLNIRQELEGAQEDCGDNFCADCWARFHRRGKRAKHVWLGYQEGEPACVACRVKPAATKCLQCNDNLCTTCATRTHRRGKKARHVLMPFKEQWNPPEEPESPQRRRYSGFSDMSDDSKKKKKKKESKPKDPYCKKCTRRVANDDCAFCKEQLCDSCNKFDHRDCRVRKLLGDEAFEMPTECALCGKVPDVVCEQCGEVYCSVKWMGNPGCFVKHHRKGNRKNHTKAPYTFVERLKRKEEEIKQEERQKVEQEERAKQQERDHAAQLEAMKNDWQMEQEERLKVEAEILLKKRIVDRRKETIRRLLHLPKVDGDGNLLPSTQNLITPANALLNNERLSSVLAKTKNTKAPLSSLTDSLRKPYALTQVKKKKKRDRNKLI